MIITLFVPSGGGHWAVQGPFAVPAAVQLHSSLAGTTMAVAMGESVANMLQPFWALPILAIAGIPDAPSHGLHGRHILHLRNCLRPFIALPNSPAVNHLKDIPMRSRSRLVFALLALFPVPALSVRASEPAFKLQNTWKLGGDGSWDYMAIDPIAHLLYIARLNRIMLVDIQSGKLVTEITGLTHAHGVAFDDQGKLGYMFDGGAGTILVFDRASRKTLATIPAGRTLMPCSSSRHSAASSRSTAAATMPP